MGSSASHQGVPLASAAVARHLGLGCLRRRVSRRRASSCGACHSSLVFELDGDGLETTSLKTNDLGWSGRSQPERLVPLQVDIRYDAVGIDDAALLALPTSLVWGTSDLCSKTDCDGLRWNARDDSCGSFFYCSTDRTKNRRRCFNTTILKSDPVLGRVQLPCAARAPGGTKLA